MQSYYPGPPALGRMVATACCALVLAIFPNLDRANATPCDPVISFTLTPPYAPADSGWSVTIELSSNRSVTLPFYIANLGCAPLEWKVRDVEPGTQLDCAWISESPDSGTVPAAGSTPGFEGLSVQVAPLPGGTYETELRFTSNDPLRPRIYGSLRITSIVLTATQRHTFGQLKARYHSAPARH